MRKSRVVVKDIEVGEVTPSGVFSFLAEFEVNIPSWATSLFFFIRVQNKSADAAFFEDINDFLVWYSKVLLNRKDDMHVVSFNRDEGKDWVVFVPPTLIGLDLKTRMRF